MTNPPAKQQESEFDPELKRLALVVLLGAVMTILDTTIVNVAVKTLGTEFHSSLSTIQWVLTAYTLALSMSIPITGWAVARFGAKRMWMLSLVLFIIGSLLCGAAWNVTSLIVFRVLQGFGAGMIMPIGQTMLAQKAGPQRMGRVMAVIAVPAMLAPVLGPALGGLLIDNLNWRWMFFINLPLCAIALFAAFRMLPRDTVRGKADAPLDVLGLLLVSPGLGALVYGIAEAGEGKSLGSAAVLGWSGAGLVLLALFAVHALRLKDRALVDLRLFADRTFSAANAGFFTYVGALFGMMVLLPLYFQVVHGFTPLRSGLTTAPMGLGAMLTMPIAGKLSDRIGPRRLAYTGLPVMLLGILGYTQINPDTPIWVLMAMLFVLGLGHGTMMPSMMGGMYRTLDRSQVPSATVASNVVMRVGSSIGVAALAVILQNAIKDEIPGATGNLAQVPEGAPGDIAEKLTNAFTTSFWWAFGIAAFSAVAIFFMKTKPQAGEAPADAVKVPVVDAH
ncbi:DHA2 family efflux MFS transporter permease subunit [Actinocorallia longicatena]|uniref:MDR family MFS transporter n=1 Tax=Actinocorallia longicatena TaxID=111803 RepID=A0ABP6QAW7_9ACTN